MNTTTEKMTNISGNSKLRTSDIALIALFAAIMAVCSWIMIPATVPFTMQTFGVFLAVGLLGGKRGTISIIVYLLLGAAGLPVFSGFTGGIGHILGPTGGYMIGFIFTALIMWLFERFFGKGTRSLAISMALGLVVCYAFGTAWFISVYTKNTGEIGLATALSWCVIPYIIPDVIKIVLALMLTKRLRPFVDRQG